MLSDDLAPQQNGMFDFRLGSNSAVPGCSAVVCFASRAVIGEAAYEVA
jgi:hypothetical protein